MLGKGNEKIIDSLRNQTRTKATIIFGDPIPEAGPRIHTTLVCVTSDTKWQKTHTLGITLVTYPPVNNSKTNPISSNAERHRQFFLIKPDGE